MSVLTVRDLELLDTVGDYAIVALAGAALRAGRAFFLVHRGYLWEVKRSKGEDDGQAWHLDPSCSSIDHWVEPTWLLHTKGFGT